MIKDIKIEVFPIDDKGEDADNCYLAIVMAYHWSDVEGEGGWYNTGIVVRELDPIVAFSKAMSIAKASDKYYWR